MPFFHSARNFIISNFGLPDTAGSALVLGVFALVLGVFAFYLETNFVLRK
jgi:hypothetical protein